MDASETTIYHAILITSIVLGIVFVYFTITIFRNQRRYYRSLQERLRAEVNLLEKERTRIARDLHDELGPLLSVIRIQTAEADPDIPEKKELLNKACTNIDQLTERLGGIARNLTPGILAKKGLGAALEDFFDQYRAVSDIDMQFRYEVNHLPDTDTALHVFRIIQEVVHNTVKHSGATILAVHIKEHKRKLYVLCKDNGKGMMETGQRKQGLGLESLQSRVEMLGGRSHLQSRDGTEYFFEIPLSPVYGKKDQHPNS